MISDLQQFNWVRKLFVFLKGEGEFIPESQDHMVCIGKEWLLYRNIFMDRALSIRVYPSDRHYMLIVSLNRWTLLLHMIPIRIKENLVVNCKIIYCACEVNWPVKSPIHLCHFSLGSKMVAFLALCKVKSDYIEARRWK